MVGIDYIVIAIYFLGLIAVSVIISRRIKSSEDMFIAGRNSSWWLSGMSTYMTIFSASTFVIWGGVAYRSGVVAALIGTIVGVACLLAGKFLAGRWRRMKIKSPGEYVAIRFGKKTVNLYIILGIIARGAHTAVALYAIAKVMSVLVLLPDGNQFADPSGHLAVSWAVILLGAITLIYTVLGGFLAVLMTDVIQFGVLMTIVIFMIPLSINAVGGLDNFFSILPESHFIPATSEYPWEWLILWLFINFFTIGGDWPFVQRYLSIPTAEGAKKSNYLVFVLYLFTPLIWYFPAMSFRALEIQSGDAALLDPVHVKQTCEQAYVLMSQTVLMKGMLGVMLAAMVSATLSTVSGTLNVFANVFTYDIYCERYPDTSEKKRIKVGRTFTLIFGLTILLMALLIPYAGGAEKVVVTVLTLVIGPLYIPSIWGVFSSYVTQKHVIITLIITYILGIAMKFGLTGVFNSNMIDATAGLIIPFVLMGIMECIGRSKSTHDEGFDKIASIQDPDADKEPSKEMKEITRNYSHMAITCFVSTLFGIATLLCVLLFVDDCTPEVETIMKSTIAIIYLLTLVYVIYRVVDAKTKNVNE